MRQALLLIVMTASLTSCAQKEDVKKKFNEYQISAELLTINLKDGVSQRIADQPSSPNIFNQNCDTPKPAKGISKVTVAKAAAKTPKSTGPSWRARIIWVKKAQPPPINEPIHNNETSLAAFFIFI